MYVAPLANAFLASDGGGEHIDPVEDEILATTDVQDPDGTVHGLSVGTYHARVTISATNLDSAGAVCEIRHVAGGLGAMDKDGNVIAAGDVVERMVVLCPVDQCWPFDVVFSCENGDSITVVPYLGGFLGTVWAAINYQRVR